MLNWNQIGGVTLGFNLLRIATTPQREHAGDVGPIDLDKTTTTLEPDKSSSGGLFVPGKERVVFKPSERKSLLGLDALAIAKRGEAAVESGFKVPRERLASVASSLDEDEEASAASGIDELGSGASNVSRNNVQRRYRESYASETSVSGGAVTNEREDAETLLRPPLDENTEVRAASSGSLRSTISRGESVDRERDGSRYRDNYRSESREGRRRERRTSREEHHYRDSSRGYEREYDGDNGRKRSRYEGSRRTPGRSEWDDGRWEWQDTPRRDSRSGSSSKRYEPSPSPKFLGASPDSRLVSPWLGDHTPHSSGAASPWDSVAPSPIPIRASGSSIRSSSSRYGAKSSLIMSSTGSSLSEDGGDDINGASEDQNQEITESMRLEMEYNSDRAWYDREEGSTVFEGDGSSAFLGDEASFQKKEVELAKKLVSREDKSLKS
ncbi:hypothetical protein FXO38_09456 [Capsicum annuum]|nr:hypothetical protein FXO38_09456 [Capsicum annuum]